MESNGLLNQPAGLLDGVTVVEFAQNMAVPGCGRILASMGADVIKVEPPAGDATRYMAPLRRSDTDSNNELDGSSSTPDGRGYAVMNPGKRSVVVDLDDPDSASVRDALLARADVVLCAFKGRDFERYGLDYERVASINPTVVYLEHRAFGAQGPDAEEGGYDVLVQGVSGLSFVSSRSEHGRPVSVRPAYTDMSTSLASALAVVAGLHHRAKTGEGQRVQTSLLGTAHWLALPINTRFDRYDTETLAEFGDDMALQRSAGATFDEQRALYESRVLPAGGAFDLTFRHYLTSDSLISVGAFSPTLIRRFYEATGLDDPSVAGWSYRGPEWNDLVTRAEALFRSQTTDEWMATLRPLGVPCARYNTPLEALDDEGALANRFLVDLDHPVHGTYRTVAPPLQMDRTPLRVHGPSPSLGAHTAAVLAEIANGVTKRADPGNEV